VTRTKPPKTVKALTRPIIQPMPLSRCLAMRNRKNPKAHSIDDLIDSFVRFGFKAFPTIDEATMIMVAGHGRCEALERMRTGGASPPAGIAVRDGEWLVPIIRGLSFANERERDAYMIADNQQAMAAGWVWPVLTDLINELEPAGFEGLAFSDDVLDDILSSEPEDPEPSDKPVNVRGHERGLGEPELRYQILITCKDEDDQTELLDRLKSAGLTVTAVVS
jgi:hypothetical protein